MKSEFIVRGETLRQLRSLGDLNSSEEEVLLKLIHHTKDCDRFWENRFD